LCVAIQKLSDYMKPIELLYSRINYQVDGVSLTAEFIFH
jgi:hypothetical protein